MIYTENNFDDLLDKFTEVGVITELTPQNFIDAFHSEESKKNKEIIYVWRTDQKVRRLKGESDILYIGKSVNSLAGRYTESEITNTEVKTSNNLLKYEHILQNYGGKIKLFVLRLSQIDFKKPKSKKDDLLYLEGQLLRWYFLNHCEYPPLNYTKTTVKNDELEIVFKI